jgi:hypothetical protein
MNKSQVLHIIGGSIVGLLAGFGIAVIILLGYFVLFRIPGNGVVGGIMLMVCMIIGGILGDRHWTKQQTNDSGNLGQTEPVHACKSEEAVVPTSLDSIHLSNRVLNRLEL